MIRQAIHALPFYITCVLRNSAYALAPFTALASDIYPSDVLSCFGFCRTMHDICISTSTISPNNGRTTARKDPFVSAKYWEIMAVLSDWWTYVSPTYVYILTWGYL